MTEGWGPTALDIEKPIHLSGDLLSKVAVSFETRCGLLGIFTGFKGFAGGGKPRGAVWLVFSTNVENER
jgi:hypothetical protein